MMRPAVFGQIIILIVFIPILSLTGVEGKMFRPMALSFGFALIGAMILSLTYVPVMASLICKPSKNGGTNLSDRIMNVFQRIYHPVIKWALQHKKIVLGVSIGLLVFSASVFLRMGGEFIPTLDEGDFVVQPVLKTGTSLGKTVDIMTDLERILINQFPEVEQVVTRIGAAEVPTDPMSMEETDVIIKLKPKKQWVNSSSKEELANQMKIAMSAIPGLDFEFTQPIEMRFNELITGVRSDVAVKIYGEDLQILYDLGQQVTEMIKGVPGASDITLEKIVGLPQMAIKYNRDKIALYGLNIKDLNRLVRMAFAGESAGVVREGEQQFDLVVRFGEDFRTDIGNLQQLYVDLPSGHQVPLEEVATVAYNYGPAKISRDDTKRRIVIGINVRSRDVETLVEEIQLILDQNLSLPSGYYLTYGGQFENLKNAKKRLMVVVPIALALIFAMLYFTFKSVRQALMIYTAIPLAAIGGVLLLWIRGLPFSISAGIGFIALFGIAVLNGIVLIEFFNELKESGVKNVQERVLEGTKMRLRPILLTASAAALGFFPMALSTSVGAEVQRPLATVVIGGLISATLLTLVVLPLLYSIFNKETDLKHQSNQPSKTPLKTGVILLLVFGTWLWPSSSNAQEKISLEQAISLAWEHNRNLQATGLKIEQQQKLEKTAFNFDKTGVYYSYNENDIAIDGTPLNVYGVSQSIPFPTTFSKQKQYQVQNTELRKIEHQLNLTETAKEVSQIYYEVLYRSNRLQQLIYLDSLYTRFIEASRRRFELGETDYLETITAEARHLELNTQKQHAASDVEYNYQRLKSIIQIDHDFEIVFKNLPMLDTNVAVTDSLPVSHPGAEYYSQLHRLAETQIKVEKSKLLPNLHGEYFLGRSQGEEALYFNGYKFGLGIPLLGGAQRSKVQASIIEREIREREAESYNLRLQARLDQLNDLLEKYGESVRYYQDRGLTMSEEIVAMAERSYLSGETGYLQYIVSLESASQIKLSYLENLNLYNQTVLEIKYLVRP